MSANPRPTFSDTDKLMHLSLLLKAMDDLDSELAIFKADHKARKEKLTDELQRLRWEVLSGQERLPLEPISPSAIVPVMEKVAEAINNGALDRDGIRCRAEVSEHAPDEESSAEEKARTRKTKKKLEGQDALLPGGPSPVVEMPKPGAGE
jgi:hypothetical protein